MIRETKNSFLYLVLQDPILVREITSVTLEKYIPLRRQIEKKTWNPFNKFEPLPIK